MSYLYLEPEILSKVIGGTSLKKALRDAFCSRVLKDSEKRSVISDVRMMLRNYQCLAFEQLDFFLFKRDSLPFFFNLVALFHLRKKDVLADEVKRFYQKGARLETSMDTERDFPLLVKASEHPFVIPEKAKEIVFVYLSLVYEVPAFLVGNLSSVFAKKDLIRVLSSYWKRKKECYILSPFSTEEKKINLDSRFSSILLSSKRRLYLSSEMNLYPDDLVRSDYAMELSLEDVLLSSLRPNVLLSSFSLPLVLSLGERTKESFGRLVHVLVSDDHERELVEVAKEKYSLSYLNPFSSSSLSTSFESKSMDLVYVFSLDTGSCDTASSFVLPSLKKESLSMASLKMLDRLVFYSDYVKKNGYLVLLSSSFSKEETLDVSNRFLNLKSKEFSLVLSRYVLFDEAGTSCRYFMIFRRKC